MYSFVNQHIKLDDDGGPDVGVNGMLGGWTEVLLLVSPISDPLISESLLSPYFFFNSIQFSKRGPFSGLHENTSQIRIFIWVLWQLKEGKNS